MELDFPDPPTPFAPLTDSERVVYRHARLFDGTGVPTRPATITIEGPRILAVTDGDDPGDGTARVVDLDGRVVVPGLVDTHQHLATPPNRAVAEFALRRQAYGGVTTIRDMADDLRQVGDLARAALVGEIPGPDVRYAALMAGPGFFDDPRTWQVSQGDTPGAVPWMQAITVDTDLRLAVARARGTHAAAVKLYADLPAALVAAVTAEAHRQGMRVWAHAAIFPATPGDVVAAGVDVVSHATMLAYELDSTDSTSYRDKRPIEPESVRADDPRLARLFALMREHGTVLDATAGLWTRDEDPDPAAAARARANTELAARLTARAHRAGVAVSAGTDYETDRGDPWPALHRELAFLVDRCGFSPAEALRAATAVGAHAAGIAADAGTVEPGKLANLVVLAGDPTHDIAELAGVELVVKRGRALPRADYATEATVVRPD